MTRNTRLFNANIPGIEIIFRNLNVTELEIINRINNVAYKQEVAFDFAVTKGSTDDFMIKNTVGKQIIEQSMNIIADEDLFDITVQAHRDNVQSDMILNMIKFIVSSMNVSVDYLMKCNIDDLIELCTMCEYINNKRFFKAGDIRPKQKTEAVNGKNFIPEEKQMSLAEKMREAQKELK